MFRPSRLLLGTLLVIAAGCSAAPTAPTPAPNAIAPTPGALMDETDDCRSGFSNPNGKTCP